MSVYLFEKTPEGVLTETVDIRGGRTVDDTADAVRARKVGEGVLAWWRHGNREWVVHVHGKDPLQPPMEVDLRRELLRCLQEGGRISWAAKYLAVHKDGRSVYIGQAEEHAQAIGQDVVSWFQTEGLNARASNGMRLAAVLNQQWKRFELRWAARDGQG